jgi:hypothetical protein
MNRSIAAQAVAACLSVLVTVCTVLALNALAGSERAGVDAQQLAVAATSRLTHLDASRIHQGASGNGCPFCIAAQAGPTPAPGASAHTMRTRNAGDDP